MSPLRLTSRSDILSVLRAVQESLARDVAQLGIEKLLDQIANEGVSLGYDQEEVGQEAMTTGCGSPVDRSPGIPCGTTTDGFVHLCHGCRITNLEESQTATERVRALLQEAMESDVHGPRIKAILAEIDEYVRDKPVNYTGPDAVRCAYEPCSNHLKRSDLPGPQWCSKRHREMTG